MSPAMSDWDDESALMDEARLVATDAFCLQSPLISRLPGGRVNESFLADTAKGRFVLQRINDSFQGSAPCISAAKGLKNHHLPAYTAVSDNWRAVYLAIEERSGLPELPIPPIYADREGHWLTSSCLEHAGFWRLTGFVAGVAAPKTPAGAKEAARLLGFFHRHLNQPLPIELSSLPEGEFTNQHLTTAVELECIFDDYRGHPCLAELTALLKRAVSAAYGFWIKPDFISVFNLREVVIHGDPKADNFIFDPSGRAMALLDWDSVGLGHVLVDVAELLRSWASFEPGGKPDFDCLASAVEGYAECGLELSLEEVEMLPTVLRAITLNLCRRYLIDALAQIYFRLDQAAYPSLFHQNRSRAEAMLNVAEHLMDIEITLGRLLAASYEAGRAKRYSGC